MNIQEFLETNPIDKNSLWAKKFSDVHLPTEDRFSGTTLCGTPMLGNNYATQAVEENRTVCLDCLSYFKFSEPVTAWGDQQLEKNPFTQLCVWHACVVIPPGMLPGSEKAKEKVSEFEAFMAKEFNGTRVKYAEEVLTLLDVENGKAVPDTGGRNDLFFYVHTDDLGKFAVPRLAYGIRWWEDVLGNGGGVLYPDAILEKYPNGWKQGGSFEHEEGIEEEN